MSIPKLSNNACFQIVGPSGSGNTHFVCKLLQNEKLFVNKFKNIYWHQSGRGEAGLTSKELCKIKHIKFIKGFDKNWSKRLSKGDVIVIDDLYQKQTLIIYSQKFHVTVK